MASMFKVVPYYQQIFENLQSKCIETYEPDPAHFSSAPRLSRQACLKNTGIESEFLIDTDMLQLVETGTKIGIRHAIHPYAKTNNIYINIYIYIYI